LIIWKYAVPDWGTRFAYPIASGKPESCLVSVSSLLGIAYSCGSLPEKKDDSGGMGTVCMQESRDKVSSLVELIEAARKRGKPHHK
jgi:hypothetical protein